MSVDILHKAKTKVKQPPKGSPQRNLKNIRENICSVTDSFEGIMYA